MEEFIKKKEAIMAIISEPPEAHYPSWYYDKIDNLDVYRFNCTNNSDKLRGIFIKVCKLIKTVWIRLIANKTSIINRLI